MMYSCSFFHWLLLIYSFGLSSETCKTCGLCHPCKCHRMEQLVNMDCTYRSLTSIPSFNETVRNNIRVLNMSYNNISKLEAESFKGMNNLAVLLLNNNNIDTIPPNAFRTLMNLRVLNLHRNNISIISGESFKGLSNLNLLDLSMNRLITLGDHSFEYLSNLSTLNVSSNYLKEMRATTFQGLMTLQCLLLSNNTISEITDHAFTSLSLLQYMDLNQNHLTTIGTGAFKGLDFLQKLNLQNNKLKEIPSAFWHISLPNITLDLRDNQFNCTCNSKRSASLLRNMFGEVRISLFNCSSDLTSRNCQDHINLAVAMNVTVPGLLDNHGKIKFLRNINDGDLDTYLTLQMNHWNNKDNNGEDRGKTDRAVFIQIHLEAVTVVRQVLVYGKRSIGDATIFVTRNQSDQLCGRCSRTTNDKSCKSLTKFQPPCNVSCNTPVYGSSIKVMFEVKEYPDNCSLKYQSKIINEVVVFGYELGVYNVWGSWGRWSTCTKTCGGGKSNRYRYCNNPTSLKCPIRKSKVGGQWDGEVRMCGNKTCPEGIWFGIIGGVAGVFVLGLIGVLYRGMEFKIDQHRPQYAVSEIWHTNFGYVSDEQSVRSTDC